MSLYNKKTLYYEDVLDMNVYDEVWLPFGDNKHADVYQLIAQDRIKGQIPD